MGVSEKTNNEALRFDTFISFTAIVTTAFLFFIFTGCVRPTENNKPETTPDSRHEYKDIKPDTYPVPEGVKKALPGLLNDNIYIYREIAPTLNLVVYTPEYSAEGAVRMAAQAFMALSGDPEFRREVSFWIIQIQPDPPTQKKSPGESGKSELVVWGVKPEEVDSYIKSKDLKEFIRSSEYLSVNDEIIRNGDERLKHFPGLKGAPEAIPEKEPSPGGDVIPEAPMEPEGSSPKEEDQP